MADVVLDACILVNLEGGDHLTRVAVDERVRREDALLLAGATYAEVWRGDRGGRSWTMRQLLRMVTPISTTERVGRRAGELLELADVGPTFGFDAIVVATAELQRADVLTDDLDDIAFLALYAHNVRVLSIHDTS